MQEGIDKAPFNMAINTLERLGAILTDIRKVDQMIMLEPEQRQEIKVSLVKDFYIQASPLLLDHAKEKKKEIQEKVLSLTSSSLKRLININGIQQQRGVKLIYSEELDKKLNEILIEIQDVLQQGKYYMPPRRDLRKAVAEF